MKLRSKSAIGLIVACGVLLVIIRGDIAPGAVQSGQQEVPKDPDPLTQGFESISEHKSRYMGDASNLTGLFYKLPLSDLDMSFKLYPETLTAEVDYKTAIHEVDEDILNTALVYNATAAFSLIENLEAVIFNFQGGSFRIFRKDVEDWYGVDLKALAEEAPWREKVQGRLKDKDYIKDFLKAIVAYEGRKAAEALTDFYDNTAEPIVIYDELPFKEGTLVLAEKLTDGEHYPDLHYIDDRGRVAYLTRGSSCWSLNYTEFKGHYIYYGLAGVEARRFGGNQTPVEKLEALFSDKMADVIPREEIIEHIHPKENDTRIFDAPQGYIMPIEGRSIPEDFIYVLKNGERKHIARLQIGWNMENMPEYLKSKDKEVYNSFAFAFTPMLAPAEWSKGYKDREICLEGSTDSKDNRNVLYLRPAGHMSFLDSFVLPLDIKPLYMSDNSQRAAVFSAGETAAVKYPVGRKLVDCRILGLSREKAEKDLGQDSLEVIEIGAGGQLKLPRDKGHYLFLLRTEENDAIQTYTGMFIIR